MHEMPIFVLKLSIILNDVSKLTHCQKYDTKQVAFDANLYDISVKLKKNNEYRYGIQFANSKISR